MVSQSADLATLLYLLPYLLVLVLRSRKDRELWEIALDLPFTAAIDLLGILLLSRLVTLEKAVFLSRPLWLACGAAYGLARFRRGVRPAWPQALGARDVAAALLAAALAVWVSTALSRECHNADRAWHIPLVVSLRGQSIPFVNVYEPQRTLAYHFTGDVLAAELQTLSLGVLHSSFALSLAHDVMFGLTGATLALLLGWLGFRRFTPVGLSVLGLLLAGPLTLLRESRDRLDGGYNFINFLKLSYRPHVSLAGLLIVGFLGIVLVRLRERERPPPAGRTFPVLLAITALLAVTDEASIGVLGLALGATWLVAPEILHPKRAVGVAVLVGLLAAVVLPNIVFAASFAPGASHHVTKLVAWRSPGYFHPELPLTSKAGMSALRYDLWPTALLMLGGLAYLLRRPSAERLAHFVFAAAIAVVSVVTLTRLDVDGLPVENHRFMTAAMLALPVLGVSWLAPLRAGVQRARGAGALVTSLVVGGMALSAFSTAEWLRVVAPTRCTKPSRYSSPDNFFKTDCVKDAGAELGLRPAPHYMEESSWYLYAGCRPVFSAGPSAEHWQLKIGLASFGRSSFREVDRAMAPKDQSLKVVCPASRPRKTDWACEVALLAGTCKPMGERLKLCEVSPAQRDEIEEKWAPPKKAPAGEKAPPEPEPEPEGEPGGAGTSGAE